MDVLVNLLLHQMSVSIFLTLNCRNISFWIYKNVKDTLVPWLVYEPFKICFKDHFVKYHQHISINKQFNLTATLTTPHIIVCVKLYVLYMILASKIIGVKIKRLKVLFTVYRFKLNALTPYLAV